MAVQPTRLNPDPSELVWIKCPSPVIALGLKHTLSAAGYLCCVQQEPPVEKNPSFVIYYPSEEDVASEMKHLREQVPDATILVVGLHNDLLLADEALRAGARGFIHVEMHPEQMLHVLSLADEGEVVLPKALVRHLLERGKLSTLSTRQREILNLVAEGQTNAEIAKQLLVTENTIKQHLRAIYKLLGVRNRNEAAKRYQRSASNGGGFMKALW